ncbi:hypothetical protein ACFVZ3_06450 [Kitasatospora purpeofusca]
MTVFFCSKCGTAITPELTELAAVPDASVRFSDCSAKRVGPDSV